MVVITLLFDLSDPFPFPRFMVIFLFYDMIFSPLDWVSIVDFLTGLGFLILPYLISFPSEA